MLFFLTFPFTDPPIDKAPAQSTAGEQVLQQHSKTAKTLLGDFNLNEAGKLVQKRRPATSILDEELLLSEDEAETAPTPKKSAPDSDTKEVAKASSANAGHDNQSQSDKLNMKALGGPMRMPLQSGGGGGGGIGGGGIQAKRRRTAPSNLNRQPNNGPMNMNMNMNQNDSMGRDDLFMRKRNFLDSDMGFDRQGNDRGFQSMGGGGGGGGGGSNNFMNDRNINNNNMNSNNFGGNNRGDFGDEFSRRPGKNDGFSNFGNRSGANGGGNSGAGGGGGNNGGGGRMFNRY